MFGDDIERNHKRALLNALVDTSPTVLGFLYTTLASSFQTATAASASGDQQAAWEQLAVLRAALGAL